MKTRYFAIYCTMDGDVGANPLWHTCLLLAKTNEQTNKVEIVDRLGFYGLPTTQGDSIWRKLKIAVGMDVDLWGNHGMLRREELRFLDTGAGLHGVPFEISEEKFNLVLQRAKKMMAKQDEPISEITSGLNLQGKNKYRIYKYENISNHIFALENAAAAEAGRSPRLKPFALSYNEPHTCKMQVLRLLDGILTVEQIEHITGWHQAISRWSGEMETIHLHSTGPFTTFKKSNGDVIYNRDEKSPETKLWMTVPPQLTTYLSNEAKELFEIPYGHADEVKAMVKQLQKLCTLFRNASLDEKNRDARDILVAMLVRRYESFGAVQLKKSAAKNDSWDGYFNWRLFGEPRDADEADVEVKLKKAGSLIEGIKYSIEHSNSDVRAGELDVLISNLKSKQFEELCEIVGTRPQDEDDLLRAIC